MEDLSVNCPHCNVLLTVKKEWQNMEIECSACGKVFEIPKYEEPQSEPQKKYHYSSAYYLERNIKLALDAFSFLAGIFAFFMVVLLGISLIHTFNKNAPDSKMMWILFAASCPLGVVGIWILKFVSDLKKPYKRITANFMKSALLIIYGVLNTVACIAVIGGTCFMLAQGKGHPSWFIGVAVIAPGIIAIFPVMKFYKLRAQEDAGFTDEEILESKKIFKKINANGNNTCGINAWRSAARICAFMSLLPFAGILFVLLSVLFIWLAIKKGQDEMAKIICLTILGGIINLICIIAAAG